MHSIGKTSWFPTSGPGVGHAETDIIVITFLFAYMFKVIPFVNLIFNIYRS